MPDQSTDGHARRSNRHLDLRELEQQYLNGATVDDLAGRFDAERVLVRLLLEHMGHPADLDDDPLAELDHAIGGPAPHRAGFTGHAAHPFDLLDDPESDPLAGLDDYDLDPMWIPREEHRLCLVCERWQPHEPDTTGCIDCREPRGRHGRVSAIKGSCGCDDCIEEAVQLQQIRRDRWAGATLEECGKRLGVTRERVRQILSKIFPDDDYDAIERERQALEEEAEAVSLMDATCRTCGGQLPSPSRAFCTALCREVWNQVRFHIDEERWQRHQAAAAKSAGRELPTGEGNRYGERWLNPGSVVWHAARLIILNDWPLANAFPEDLLKEHITPYLSLDGRGADADTAPPFDVAAVVDKIEHGTTPAALADQLKVTVGDIRRETVAATSPSWWRHNVVVEHAEEMLATARQLLENGATIASAARDSGLSAITLRLRLADEFGQDWWDAHGSKRGTGAEVSDDDLLDAAALLESGGTLAEASEMLGVSDQIARARLSETFGEDWYAQTVLPRGDAGPVLEDEQLRDALQRVATEGVTSVAADYGVTRQALGKALRKIAETEWWGEVVTARLPSRDPQAPRDRVAAHADPDRLIALLRDGMEVDDAAEKTDVPTGLAYRFLKDELGEEYNRLVARTFGDSHGDVDLWISRLRDGVPFEQVLADAELSEPSVRVLLASAVGVDEYRALTGDEPDEAGSPEPLRSDIRGQ